MDFNNENNNVVGGGGVYLMLASYNFGHKHDNLKLPLHPGTCFKVYGCSRLVDYGSLIVVAVIFQIHAITLGLFLCHSYTRGSHYTLVQTLRTLCFINTLWLVAGSYVSGYL